MQSGPSATENAAPERATNPLIRTAARTRLDALSQVRMREFLQRRLLFSSLAISITLTSLLLLEAATGGHWGTIWIVFAGILVTCSWSLTVILLHVRTINDERSLRRIEAIAFGCGFATLACLIFANLESTSRTHEFHKYMLTLRESQLISVVLVAIYGIIIPNRSRRSLLIASSLAAIPMAAIVASLVSHAPAFPNVTVAAQLQIAVESMMLLIGAICCATLGASVSEKIRDRNNNIEELGSYVLKEQLGSGGMGDVYLAEHRLLKRLCAVKLIHPDKARDSRVRARFEQEVKATAGLTHPNTIQVYDYGTSPDGRFFYAMEFLEGLNLHQYVQQFGIMSPGRVVYLLKQICGALHEAWCEGLVHRDIKPSNIFLSERGHMFDVAKLLDFGLVQPALGYDVNIRRVHTQIQGSPAFMCPEQSSGLEPDCRGDIYSLGAVAWFLLTGYPPFRDENPIMLIVANATEPVPDFSATGVSVPEDLVSIITRCLAKKPEERFHIPRDLLAALEECTANEEWTWKDAEDWWLANIPARFEASRLAKECSFELEDQKAKSTPAIGPLSDTLIFDREVVAAAVPAGSSLLMSD